MSFSEELNLYIRAGHPLIWVTALELDRALEAIRDAAENIRYEGESSYSSASSRTLADHMKVWKATTGWDESSNEAIQSDVPEEIMNFEDYSLCVLMNFHWYIGSGDAPDPVLIQSFIDGYFQWKGLNPRTVIVLSPVYDIAKELERLFQRIDYTLPSNEELKDTLVNLVEVQEGQLEMPDDDTILRIIESGAGLTGNEFEGAIAFSVLKSPNKKIEPSIVLEEKAKTLTKTGYLQYWPSLDDLSSVGGLNNLKSWLAKREKGLTKEARDFGLPYPKGMMLTGIPGTGKSLVAKCIAKQWEQQLIRLDLTKVFGSLVGESEERMRMIQAQIEALAPLVLWIDEAEKGFAGANSGAVTDSGVTRKVFGSFITWMQERPQDKLIYVVMTANDVLSLPPELLRKGRFDAIFWVDLPGDVAREEIFKIHLKKRGQDSKDILKALPELVASTNGFSGSEIEAIIEDGMFEAFFRDDTELRVDDLFKAIETTIPLSKTRESEVAAMRAWAENKCVFAEINSNTNSSSRVKSMRKIQANI